MRKDCTGYASERDDKHPGLWYTILMNGGSEMEQKLIEDELKKVVGGTGENEENKTEVVSLWENE